MNNKKYKKAYIEITNVCNLDCAFCIKTNRKKEFITLENFEYVATKAREFTNHIYLHVLGEPLLHKNFREILGIANAKGLNINITTNGSLINQALDALLQEKVRKIAFSLHSYGGNNADNNFSDYLNNILRAVDALKKDTICELRFWNGLQNTPNELNLQMLNAIKQHFNSAENLQLVQEGVGYKIEKNVYIGYDSQFAWPTLSSPICVTKKFCYGLRDQFAVLVDGSVTPCCIDSQGDITLGNIYNSSLADILNSEKATKIYTSFSQNTPTEELCKRCKF